MTEECNMDKYYIFPLNYDVPEKFMGMIEYKILAIIGIIGLLNFYILGAIKIAVDVKIYILMFSFFLPSIIMILGINGDNIFVFMKYFFRYMTNKKVYLYKE